MTVLRWKIELFNSKNGGSSKAKKGLENKAAQGERKKGGEVFKRVLVVRFLGLLGGLKCKPSPKEPGGGGRNDMCQCCCSDRTPEDE